MLCCYLLEGCSSPPVKSITTDFHILKEEPFLINYPTDWHISSAIDDSDKDIRKVFYYFRHPQNNFCYFIIEKIIFPTQGNRKNKINQIFANQLRQLKESFQKEGYRNFIAQTFRTQLAGKEIRKLKITATKGNIKREMGIYVVPRRTDFYIITYNWLDTWNQAAKILLLKRIHSFRFTHW